ncbi:hypothetical protein [Pararhizobium antarcticum]|uniref:Uncharacterized protein n=1 Tax=Pararhizobium antarcticum TaxID=1798805 RepID=A0A657LUY1_9HYPH|nr:hypothetical protein [Pararhizobium antarcticum]OJF98907.1 hypothetical protein AX760_01420 [Pararhizobium antarcticum]OJF98940.1 hypothetical protein AX760_02390 [Pararhizobium antarcticum]OJF99176.1 hypothetical protein AX761_11850 [Rhizobium sp. 58]
MLSFDATTPSGTPSATQAGTQAGTAQPAITTAEPGLPMELIELELSLDGFTAGAAGFSAHMRAAVAGIGGAFLFELPASGLIANCDRIAVLRLREGGGSAMTTIFACLERDGATIRIERPSEATAGLANFADAFVDVLERI